MTRRRFARCFQIDPTHPGVELQRLALRDALTPTWITPRKYTDRPFWNPTFGSDFDYLNWRLAGAVKKVRPFILLGFHPDMQHPSLSSPAAVNFSDKLDPAGVRHFALWEFGWLVNHYLLTEDDKQWFMAQVGADNFGIPVQEQFAGAVNEWVQGTSWQALNPILLRDASR